MVLALQHLLPDHSRARQIYSTLAQWVPISTWVEIDKYESMSLQRTFVKRKQNVCDDLQESSDPWHAW